MTPGGGGERTTCPGGGGDARPGGGGDALGGGGGDATTGGGGASGGGGGNAATGSGGGFGGRSTCNSFLPALANISARVPFSASTCAATTATQQNRTEAATFIVALSRARG